MGMIKKVIIKTAAGISIKKATLPDGSYVWPPVRVVQPPRLERLA